VTSHIDIVRANFARRSSIQSELREIDEAATSDQRDYSEAEAGRIAELRSELEAVDGRISANLAIEERSADLSRGVESLLGAVMRGDGEVADTRSLGEQFVGLDEFRAWADAGARGASPALTSNLDLRAVTDTTTGATSGGAWINNQRLGRVGNDALDRRVYLLDLLPSISVSTGAVEYVQDKSPLADLANKAAEVTEGSAKPQAGITTEVVTEATATIAAWANMTRQVVADAPQVQGYIDGRLRYALKRRTDGQVIAGNGTAPNLRGLANRSGIVTHAPASAEARYLSIRRAMRLMEDAEAVPEIVVLNPADAELFDVSNHAGNGLHAVPNVAGASARTAWGMTQVRSTAIASGTALLIDPMALAVLDRQQVSAYLTDSHASNFTSNILTLLLEARVGLALFDPAGVAKVTFNGTA
jgi:HK97 family phage major capsid protein